MTHVEALERIKYMCEETEGSIRMAIAAICAEALGDLVRPQICPTHGTPLRKLHEDIGDECEVCFVSTFNHTETGVAKEDR